MTASNLVLYPNPILRAVSAPCHENDAHLTENISNLKEMMEVHPGVGIAAPQINISKRIILVDATKAKRPVENHGRLILLNPVIVSHSGRQFFREGCMSIPDMVANVPRYDEITVAAYDQDFRPVIIETRGFESVILQHEIDHLDGILFIDRVRSARDIKIRTG